MWGKLSAIVAAIFVLGVSPVGAQQSPVPSLSGEHISDEHRAAALRLIEASGAREALVVAVRDVVPLMINSDPTIPASEKPMVITLCCRRR